MNSSNLKSDEKMWNNFWKSYPGNILGSLSSVSCGEATPPEDGHAPSPTSLEHCGDEGAWRGSSIVSLR